MCFFKSDNTAFNFPAPVAYGPHTGGPIVQWFFKEKALRAVRVI